MVAVQLPESTNLSLHCHIIFDNVPATNGISDKQFLHSSNALPIVSEQRYTAVKYTAVSTGLLCSFNKIHQVCMRIPMCILSKHL